MTLHQLEFFYNIGKFGGMEEARRSMPYTVLMPAISKQIAALEKDLGHRLFERHPFQLTRAGEKVFNRIKTFFEDIEILRNELRAEAGKRLGIGAPEIVLREHLKEPLAAVKQQFKQMEFELLDGDQASLEVMLRQRKIDVAIAVLDTKPAKGLCAEPLVKLPVALIVPQKMKAKTVDQVWAGIEKDPRFVWLPPKHSSTRLFQSALMQRGITPSSVTQLQTVDLVVRYVLNGYGVGVAVMVPGVELPKGVRLLPLEDFEPLTVALLWQQKPNAQMKAFIEAARKWANQPNVNPKP